MTHNVGYIQTGTGQNKLFLRIRYIGGIPHYDLVKEKTQATKFLRKHFDELKPMNPKDRFVKI